MAQKAKKYRPMTSFLTAMVLSFCVLGFGGACLVIECNMRQSMYGNVQLELSYQLDNGVPQLTDGSKPLLTLDSPKRQAITALIAAPRRLVMAVLQAENAIFAQFWERFSK